MKRLKKIMQVVPAVALAMPLLLLSIGATPDTVAPIKLGPRLEMTSFVCDFGTSTVRELDGEFRFRNTGDEPLTLSKPGTSCGCTVAEVSPNVLAPGKYGKLTFHLSVPSTAAGVIEKHIYLPSNDPNQSNVGLTVRLVRVALFELEPSTISFNELRTGITTNVTVRVRRTDGMSLDGLEFHSSAKFITAQLQMDSTASTNTGVITVSLKTDSPPRWLHECVSLWPRNATQEMAGVWIYGRIVGEVTLSRDEIYWAVLDRNHPGARTIRARLSQPNRTLEIKNLQCTLKDVKLSAQRTPDGQGYEIAIELLRVSDALTKGQITFETNAASQPKVTVPITINLLRQ